MSKTGLHAPAPTSPKGVPSLTTSEARKIRAALLASVSVLLCVAALALVGVYLDRSRPPAADEAATTVPPAIQISTSDPERAAWQAVRLVASATDTGRPTPEVPSCEEALDRPTDVRCAYYETTLQDFLEDAREACNEPGFARAEDLSCVPAGFFGHPRV